MAFKDTIKGLRDLLAHITLDLEKAENGNKAASQRVRTGTVKLEKVAKLYRKESIKAEKAIKGTKKPGKKVAAKATSSKAKSSVSKSKTPVKAPAKAKLKAKPSAKATTAKARQLSFKKPTAKLPVRRHSVR